MRQIGLAVAATVTVEREQLIGQAHKHARHDKWDTHDAVDDITSTDSAIDGLYSTVFATKMR